MNDGYLIELVYSYPHLYDRRRSDFKDIKKKNNSWTEIATVLGYSAEDVQSRWKYLREKYTREKSNIHNMESGSGAAKKPEWHYFKSLTWLDTYIQKRRTTTNLTENQHNEILEIREEESLPNLPDFTVMADCSESQTGSREDMNVHEGSSSGRTHLMLPQEAPVECKRGSQKENYAGEALKNIGTAMQQTLNMIKGKRQEPAIEDEEDIFGRYVASVLKKKKEGTAKKNHAATFSQPFRK